MRVRRIVTCVICVMILVPFLAGITAFVFMRQAISRITIGPQAAQEAVLITLDKGDLKQKLETIRVLGNMGVDAKPFIPALLSLTHDTDPEISNAALRSVRQIDPTAIDDGGDQ